MSKRSTTKDARFTLKQDDELPDSDEAAGPIRLKIFPVTLRFNQATVESITQNFDALNLHHDVIDVGKRKRDLCEDELKARGSSWKRPEPDTTSYIGFSMEQIQDIQTGSVFTFLCKYRYLPHSGQLCPKRRINSKY